MSEIKTLNGHNLVDTAATAKLNSIIETVGGDTLEWVTSTAGRVRVGETSLYKFSDAAPTLNDFANGATLRGEGGEVPLEFVEIAENLLAATTDMFIVALADGAVLEDAGIVFPEKGMYFDFELVGDDEGSTLFLTIPGYTGFATEKIKQDALPEGVNDWNQMQNRPFGDEITEIMPETEITGNAESEPVEFTVNGYVDGSDVVIVFDGVEYACVQFFVEGGMYYYGNAAMVGVGADTGEPFVLGLNQSAGVGILMPNDVNTHTISISLNNITKIPDRYYDRQTVFYYVGNNYIYSILKDGGEATFSDLLNAINKGPIIVQQAVGAVPIGIYCTVLYVMCDFSEAPYATVKIHNGSEIQTLYTAEYTGT